MAKKDFLVTVSVTPDTNTDLLSQRIKQQLLNIANPYRDDEGIQGVHNVKPVSPLKASRTAGMTPQEAAVLQKTVEMWNAYLALPGADGTNIVADVCQHVRAIQNTLALRVAKRVNPEIWGSDGI